MKNFLLASALVLATAATAAAQTPTGTPPSGSVPPSGSTTMPKPDATIDTQVNSPGANQANPANSAGSSSSAKSDRAMKRKNGKMKAKSQPSSGM